jgi:hypothetical protein
MPPDGRCSFEGAAYPHAVVPGTTLAAFDALLQQRAKEQEKPASEAAAKAPAPERAKPAAPSAAPP